MKRIVTLALVLFLSQGAFAQHESGLSKAQIKLLRGLGQTVAVPTYLPEGFSVHKVVATIAKRGVGGGASYRILYSSRDRKGFVVEGVSSGVGHPEADIMIPVVSPVFGETFVGVYKFDGQKSVSGDWLGEGPYFRVRVTDRRHADEKRLEGNLTPETIGKIHKSLMPLRSTR